MWKNEKSLKCTEIIPQIKLYKKMFLGDILYIYDQILFTNMLNHTNNNHVFLINLEKNDNFQEIKNNPVFLLMTYSPRNF